MRNPNTIQEVESGGVARDSFERSRHGVVIISSLMNQLSFSSCLRRVIAVLAISFCTGMATAQYQLPLLPPGADTNDFTMTVKVVDAVSGQPVPGSAVEVAVLMPLPVRPSTNEWQFITNERGVATVRTPARVMALSYFALSISNAGYPPRSVSWQASQMSPSAPGSVRSALPAEYTVRLERGATIGGFVRDERGQSVAGVKVVPWGNGASVYSFSPGSAREYSILSRDGDHGVVTDDRGFWQYANFPGDISHAMVDLVRPDGSRTMFVTPSADPRFPVEPGDPVELAALQATNATMVLRDGVTIRGVVVGESGRPVAHAVVKERSGNSMNVPPASVTNDAQGRFEFPHRTGVQYLVTAEADGYAMNSVIVTPEPGLAEARIILGRAQPLRLRVLGEREEPVAGAVVTVPEYRNRGHLLTWTGTTDAEGRVTWTTAPRQEISVAIAPTNYLMRMTRLRATDSEQVVRVSRESSESIHLSLHVEDSESRQPVRAFSVWQDLQPNSGFKDSGWNGTNGLVQEELKRIDLREGWGYVYRLQVRADGYAPWTSESLYYDEGDFDTTITITRATPPRGIVLQPDGQPAADAKIMLLSLGESVFMNSPENLYPRPGTVTVKTGSDGAFALDAGEDEQRVLAIHRDGIASLTLADIRRAGKVPLQSWGRIDGVLRSDGKPLARQSVNLKSPVAWQSIGDFNLIFSATTDADGRFTFTNLPPGGYVLFRQPNVISGMTTMESHRMILEVSAGESKVVEYGFGGRTVVGHVEADGEVDWKNDYHLLTVVLPPAPAAPNYYAYADSKEFEKARRAHGRSRAMLDYERKRQQFELVFDRDGNFHVDDVPPGKYGLTIEATKPMNGAGRNRYERSQEIIGSVKRQVTIPTGPAGQEFDLGSLEMEVKDSPGVPTPALDFTADQLDGKPFSLQGLRGRPVVVCFWGQWAPGSAATLEGLRAAVSAMPGAQKPALVTVNLDSTIDAAQEGVKNLGAGWTHTHLTGPALVDVTEQWKIDTLPAVVLLDAEGRVKGRDIVGKRLGASVKRLIVAKKN